MKAEYWIAQYIEDMFRNESRNIGVIVRIGDDVAAQFIGESDSGEVDRRKLRLFKYPEVYQEWLQYWRRMIGRGAIDKILKHSQSNFRVNQGGFVTDIGSDRTDAVVDYLYSLLVSQGGFRAAVLEEEEKGTDAGRPLEDEVTKMFLDRQLIVDSEEIDFFVSAPIKKNIKVAGASCKNHRPAFVQENGRLSIIETADFTTTQKRRQRDHAGLVAYMFRDILQTRRDTEAIALVRFHETDLKNEDVAYGFALLNAEARVVNWLVEQERDEFLCEREKIARS